MNGRRGVGSAILDTVFVVVLAGLAAAVFWPVYRDTSYLVAAGGAIAGGALVALLGARARWSSFTVLLVAAGGFLVIGVPLAVPGKAIAGVLPSWDGFLDLLAGVAFGWKQLLTITLPVGDYQALLVPAALLLYAATLVGLTIALRARRGELAVVPPVAAFLVAILFGPDRALWPIPLALATFVVLLAFLVWRRWQRRREAIRHLARATPDAEGRPLETAGDASVSVRSILSGGLILGVAAVASVGAVNLAPVTGAREVLRTAVEQPFDPRDYPSPLAGFRRYLRDDRSDATMLTVTGLPAGERLRVATLDSYDGVVYAVGSPAVDAASGTFVRIPQSVDQSGVDGTPVRLEVRIDGYRGVWVPTAGAFTSIDFSGSRATALADGFYYNGTTGTAADLRGLAAGDSYRLDAVLPVEPTESQLATATPGDAEVARLGDVPEELGLYLEEKVRGLTSPGERLAAMLDALDADGYISHGLGADEPPSRSGHAADRITELVTSARMIGDAEQYAVAAALMARQLGFPARVVFGFVPGDGGVVTGSDVTAWIEVDTAQYGWVSIDPVPEERPIPEEEPEEQTQTARPPSIVPPPPDRPEPNQDQTAPDTTQDTPDESDPVLELLLAIARVGGIGVLALAVLLAPFVLILAAKARRRRLRRQAPDVVDRIRGGWDEYADAVLDHGYEAPPAASRSELAVVAGGLPARVLAAVADRAVFAPESADPADADRVWGAVAELRASLDKGLSRRQRLRARLSLRSLGAYSVRGLFRREGRSH